MLELVATLLRLAFDPAASSVLAAVLVGQPELSRELVNICRRESHCTPVRAHEGDAWAGPLMQKKALARGLLDPSCPWHRGDPSRYSTRGVHGMSAAYSLHHLGGCLPPEILDIPFFSALAAARRAQAQCARHDACDSEARHRLWAGAARWDEAQHPDEG